MKWRVVWWKSDGDHYFVKWRRYFAKDYQARDFAAVTNRWWPERCATVECVEESNGVCPLRTKDGEQAGQSVPGMLLPS